MRRLTTVFLCLALSCMTLFLSFGYAKLTDILDVDGTAEYKEPVAIYITNIEIITPEDGHVTAGTPSAEKVGFLFLKFGDFTLKKQDGWNQGGQVKFKVTLKNNSGADQYLNAYTLKNTSSRNISVNGEEGSKPGTLIPKVDAQKGENGIRTLTIIVQNTAWSETRINGIELELDFEPKFDASHTQDAATALANQFGNVLNNPNFTYTKKNGTTVTVTNTTQLLNAMGEVWNSVDTGGYFSNVSTNKDNSYNQQALINAMLGENIKFQIGNYTYTVYVLIKNQKINDDNQNDMVLYLTADQLDQGSGNWNYAGYYENLNIVPVYALVYLKQGNGYTYYNHMFAGEAPVCDPDGNFGVGEVGNFNTNLWNSTDYPNITDKDGSVSQSGISADGELDEAYTESLKSPPK